MKIMQYQVDAFATRVFEGNPAAVCPLESWLDDTLLQAIAQENNLSETAFFVPGARGFELRWFTPVDEVDLCGHATLATAHVIFDRLGYSGPVIPFETRSGELFVKKQGSRLQMDFPADPPVACGVTETLVQGLGGKRPVEVLAASDYMAVFGSEADVRAIRPDHNLLSRLDLRGIIVTAPGDEVDFVSRFFAPQLGVPEDPVTGSAHCELAPYWAGKLGRNLMTARQVSRRGGSLTCEIAGDRVLISGSAVMFMEAEISL
jgi:PhzF family phenazine biosynthesis protein